MLNSLTKLGAETLYLLNSSGRMGIFLFSCVGKIFTPPYKMSPIIRQMHFIGNRSVFVILFTGAFTGMVLGLQGYYSLKKFGAEGALGSAIALSLLRELGPVLTALMVIGRAGSAITAEIGIMRNSEQIDALECMAIDPYRYLIVPKFIAGILALPLLTFIFNVIGVVGGYLVGVGLLNVNAGVFFQSMYKAVEWQDINMGIIKSLVFGLLIIWICASKGFFLHLDRSGGFGAEGVSRTTTNAVVTASVTILVWDYLISAIML
ncbi:MAG: ABC transporter permease [Desulfuromonas sp.]|nr:MAG: ABC transporter permease [Desulfuromonas sp.]